MLEMHNLVVYGLAVWRIASLFVREEGPAHIFRKVREAAGIVHDDQGVVAIIPDTFRAQALSCVWCLSIWIGAVWTVFWLMSPEWSLKFAVPFALSAVAVIVDKWVNG